MKQVFAFARINFILLAVGMFIVILGLFLMAGSGSTHNHFNEEIFSAMRIKVAPVVSRVGYLFIIVATLFPRRKVKAEDAPQEISAEQTEA